MNGGQARAVEGTWSASLEWLVAKLAPRLPDVAFAEVRYRVKSWNRMEMCVEDTLAAVEAVTRAGSERCILLGFSMGGAVAIGASRHASVSEVIGLAPWMPDRLDLAGLKGKRFTVFHGALDRYLPGIPGVSPVNSRRGFERAQALGVAGELHADPGRAPRDRAARALGHADPAASSRPLGRPRRGRARASPGRDARGCGLGLARGLGLGLGGRRLARLGRGDAPPLELITRRAT